MSARSLLTMVLALAPASLLASEAPRLIETKPGVRYWSTAAQRAVLSRRAHQAGRCGGFRDLTNVKISPHALAPTRLDLYGREPKEQSRVNPIIARADEGALLALVTKLSSFHDRNYQTDLGVQAASFIKDRYVAIAKGRSDIKVDFFAHTDFKQPSVIAEITGSGPQKNEIVVIGGHLDSINQWQGRGGVAPGADDNASGTATVLETFRLLVESGYHPNRTILFMGYAGEEEGLLGSGEIAAWFRNKNRGVVGALQFDMTMYPGSSPRITFITDYTDRDLTKFNERLVDEYVKVKWIEDKCGYACSDHASWTASGYASAFPFETAFDEYNPNIHTPKDTTNILHPGHGVSYVKLAVAYAIELAEAQGTAWRVRR